MALFVLRALLCCLLLATTSLPTSVSATATKRTTCTTSKRKRKLRKVATRQQKKATRNRYHRGGATKNGNTPRVTSLKTEHPLMVTPRLRSGGGAPRVVACLPGVALAKPGSNHLSDNISGPKIPYNKTYAISQGKTLHLKIKSPCALDNPSTVFAGTRYRFYPRVGYNKLYECFLPIDCTQKPGTYSLVVSGTSPEGSVQTLGCKLMIEPYAFKKQRGFKISQHKLQRLAHAGIGGGRESKLIAHLIPKAPKEKLWEGTFASPINVQWITAPFGEIRFSKKTGTRHHHGVDLADTPRAPVRAGNHGVVLMKTHTPSTGNVVVIGHGRDVFTVYCHLDGFTPGLQVGKQVTKGEKIGRIGMTGYASGYHLHYEMRVGPASIATDPDQWIQQVF